MSKEKKNFNPIVILGLIGVVVFILIYGGINITKNFGKSKNVVTTERAMEALQSIYDNIDVNNIPPRKALVDLRKPDVKETLPEISKFPPQVRNTTSTYIEIFSSTEKSGKDKDGWLVEVADDFNQAGIKVGDKIVSVMVRGIASGTATDYIISGKHLPDAFTPSNELWGKMVEASGQEIFLVEKRMVGNVAGMLFSKKKNKELINKYGAINHKVITEAVAANEIAMGYTNPFASSTGLNFLITTLTTFDNKDPLSDEAVSGFEKFQTNIPFVAFTTLQMRESAETGVLDGFIMEYQTYSNSRELRSNYVFTPFGARHDNPMYQIGSLSSEKKEILEKFIKFSKKDKYRELAENYGFNHLDDYIPESREVTGDTIIQAQKLWKEKKNSNIETAAVFVTDVSGSMDGEPLNKLKTSLIVGSQYIGTDNYIGLVSFSSDVNINLPIKKFDLNQRSYFVGAVTDLKATGSTAMFDGIVVASNMLMEEKEKNPDIKLMLFVLTDGVTNHGHNFNDVRKFLEGLKIPVYTIGYNADVQVLQNLSNLNEAASINADTEDVVYKLRNLFNAQM